MHAMVRNRTIGTNSIGPSSGYSVISWPTWSLLTFESPLDGSAQRCLTVLFCVVELRLQFRLVAQMEKMLHQSGVSGFPYNHEIMDPDEGVFECASYRQCNEVYRIWGSN